MVPQAVNILEILTVGAIVSALALVALLICLVRQAKHDQIRIILSYGEAHAAPNTDRDPK